MKMNANPFAQALGNKERQIGLWVSLCDGFAAEVVSTAGYDWALLDMEHAPNSIRTVLGQLQAFSATPTTAIVRPETNDPVLVKRLLDLGADGLLFPMVQSVEEAEKAVSATRYPPNGIRGVSLATRANAFARRTDYLERVEAETSVLLQIETREALNHALEIAEVDGVDGLFFGPADIAADIGQLGKPMCNEVWDLVMPVAKKLIASGMPVGTLVQDPQFAAKLFNEGFSFVACGSDTGLLARGADNLLSAVKQAL